MESENFTGKEVDEFIESTKIHSTATGWHYFDSLNAMTDAANGDDKIMKHAGIDLTGIQGKKARMDFLIQEIKHKFTREW